MASIIGRNRRAKKAVWLASEVKETRGLFAIKLALKVEPEWLCYAHAVRQGNPGGGREARMVSCLNSGAVAIQKPT